MQAGVKRGGRVCEDPVKTLTLAWHKDDAPTPEHMVESADALLKHMGWQNHQAVLVGHNDTDHRHIHIILNRIDPDNGRTLNDYREHKRAQAWALDYERTHAQIRCEQREINADRGADRAASAERDPAAGTQHGRDHAAQPSPSRAANDHLPHNVVLMARPHERAFNAEEQAREQRDIDLRAELKAEQRAEREAFFKDGAKLFKATRHAVYDEVRKECAPEWRQFYKDADAAEHSAKAWSHSAVSRALFFAKDGRWSEAREAFSDRDSVRDAVGEELQLRKSELKERQNTDLRERQRDACDGLRESRNEQYQALLQRQRDERAAVAAGQTLDSLGVGREVARTSSERSAALAAGAANQNRDDESRARTGEQAASSEAGKPGPDQAEARADDREQDAAPAADAGVGGRGIGEAIRGVDPVGGAADLAAAGIGGAANFLADLIGELISPSPPHKHRDDVKQEKPVAEKPAPEDKTAAYARIIDAAVKAVEAEREQKQTDDACWKERNRGKGWERDQ